MTRVVWTCWFQGREQAPPLVERCLASWETRNPSWDVRCLDGVSLRRYVDLPDLAGKTITAASLADLLRIRLLREYGGVWVDATTVCNRPLDDWLPAVLGEGFFAFDRPGTERLLSTWFLAAREHDPIVGRWCAAVLGYWATRDRSDDYFWFHRLFADCCAHDPAFAAAWRRVPKIPADGPHSVQRAGMFAAVSPGDPRIDWQAPVFKLTHRGDPHAYRPGTLAWELLARAVPGAPARPVRIRAPWRRRVPARWFPGGRPCRTPPRGRTEGEGRRGGRVAARIARLLPPPLRAPWWRLQRPRSFAALKVSTQNLGDHIQILVGLRLLARLGVAPSAFLDRDRELAASETLERLPGPVGMLLNGWFKNGHAGEHWPPHEKIRPIFIGFHVRPFQCPALLSADAVRCYRAHAPIGVRDVHTGDLLASAGVPCVETNCLSLTLPRRDDAPESQTELLVASRTRDLLAVVPDRLGPRTYVDHYVESRDFERNLAAAAALLETYRTRARLIVTSFLHCALPAIAMGIPVVVFYPRNDERGAASDRERFSSLVRLVRVWRFEETDEVDWEPRPVPVAALKLAAVDWLHAWSARWSLPRPASIGPVAPPSALPPPS